MACSCKRPTGSLVGSEFGLHGHGLGPGANYRPAWRGAGFRIWGLPGGRDGISDGSASADRGGGPVAGDDAGHAGGVCQDIVAVGSAAAAASGDGPARGCVRGGGAGRGGERPAVLVGRPGEARSGY